MSDKQNFFLVKTKNNDEIDISEKYPNLFYLGGKSNPIFNNNYQTFSGQDGSTFINSSFGTSVFTANFLLKGTDYHDFILMRHEIYQTFSDRDVLRVRTSEDSNKVMYVRPGIFEINFIENGNFDSTFSIPFDIVSGYKYSFKKSDEYSIDELSFGMNFQTSDVPFYTYKLNHFRIYNPSDVAIDPYYQRHDLILKINFNGDKYKITNNTNGTTYAYNNKATISDDLILTGLVSTFNGQPASSDTNFGFLQLEKGWNDITVSGATSHETTFSFPFIYID